MDGTELRPGYAICSVLLDGRAAHSTRAGEMPMMAKIESESEHHAHQNEPGSLEVFAPLIAVAVVPFAEISDLALHVFQLYVVHGPFADVTGHVAGDRWRSAAARSQGAGREPVVTSSPLPVDRAFVVQCVRPATSAARSSRGAWSTSRPERFPASSRPDRFSDERALTRSDRRVIADLVAIIPLAAS